MKQIVLDYALYSPMMKNLHEFNMLITIFVVTFVAWYISVVYIITLMESFYCIVYIMGM